MIWCWSNLTIASQHSDGFSNLKISGKPFQIHNLEPWNYIAITWSRILSKYESWRWLRPQVLTFVRHLLLAFEESRKILAILLRPNGNEFILILKVAVHTSHLLWRNNHITIQIQTSLTTSCIIAGSFKSQLIDYAGEHIVFWDL